MNKFDMLAIRVIKRGCSVETSLRLLQRVAARRYLTPLEFVKDEYVIQMLKSICVDYELFTVSTLLDDLLELDTLRWIKGEPDLPVDKKILMCLYWKIYRTKFEGYVPHAKFRKKFPQPTN